MSADSKPRTYIQWDHIRLRGRGGKKKVRRDTTLSRNAEGVLQFFYNEKELLATLTPDNVYTLYRDDGHHYYPTYSNVFRLIAHIVTYSDMSHYKHYAQSIRVGAGANRWTKNDDGKWERAKSMPFTNGLQFKNGVCLNPEIAIDYKRVLNRTKSLPWLRKTEVLAKVLRVATRMQLLKRDLNEHFTFDMVNIDDPTAVDAEIILRKGSAMGLYRRYSNQTPEEHQAALMRCAENGLADYREWLYTKHGCYEMMPVVYSNEEGVGQ